MAVNWIQLWFLSLIHTLVAQQGKVPSCFDLEPSALVYWLLANTVLLSDKVRWITDWSAPCIDHSHKNKPVSLPVVFWEHTQTFCMSPPGPLAWTARCKHTKTQTRVLWIKKHFRKQAVEWQGPGQCLWKTLVIFADGELSVSWQLLIIARA